MKLSILLLAHKNINQIKRLLQKLRHPDVEVFIHFDKKFQISGIEIDKLLSTNPNTHVLPRRFSINTVDSSVTECILSGLRYISDNLQNARGGEGYVSLMSAQDYLIKPIESLLFTLENSYPKPFIDCTPYSQDNWIYHKFSHTPFYGKWYGSFYQKKGIIGKIGRYTVRTIDHVLQHIEPTMFSRLTKYNINLYGGSQWWILPMDMINEILQIVQSNSNMVHNLFKCIPDEIFFQTIGMQTSYCSLIQVNPPDQVSQNSLTYANFTAPGKPFCGHPHIITSEDWEWLKDYPQFIARKFDFSVDRYVFDIIDNEHKNKKRN